MNGPNSNKFEETRKSRPNRSCSKNGLQKNSIFSFRGTLRAEESLILLNLKPGEIPRFARNDKKLTFSAASFAAGMFLIELSK
jgi:hypothetical protein